MTCIVGLVQDGAVWMGGDAAAVEDGHYLSVAATPKLFVNGAYLIGYTTSFRMGQILRYQFAPPPPGRAKDLMAHMVSQFVPAMRATLSDEGWLETKDGREEGGCILVGVRGRLFEVQDDFAVLEAGCGFEAIGSGVSVGLGALYATAGGDPRARIFTALAAAESFTTGVRGPFTILEHRG